MSFENKGENIQRPVYVPELRLNAFDKICSKYKISFNAAVNKLIEDEIKREQEKENKK